jgi:carbon monoxide dehydrogenase subunit G
MDITEEFTVERHVDDVWALFLDVPEVARCLPGAELTEDHGDGSYAGNVTVKLGPISSSFEGTASVISDESSHEMEIKGKGVDRSGGSQGRVKVLVKLVGTDSGHTDVTLESHVMLAGPIAQFGRTGLVKEVSKRLIDEFGDCLYAKLEAGTDEAAAAIEAADVGGIALLFSSLWSWITSGFHKNSGADL